MNNVKKPFIPGKVRATVFERCDGECVYCGTQLAEREYDIDHLIPKSRGGTNDIENLALACQSCNRTKSDKTVDEYLEWREKERARRLSAVKFNLSLDAYEKWYEPIGMTDDEYWRLGLMMS